MRVYSGYFADPKSHHEGWFRVFRFSGIVEVWFGHYWITVAWA